jgi:hypothetical protein
MEDISLPVEKMIKKSHKKRPFLPSSIEITVYHNATCIEDPKTEKPLYLVQLGKAKSHKSKFLKQFTYYLEDSDEASSVDDERYLDYSTLKKIIMNELSEESTDEKEIDRDWENVVLFKVTNREYDNSKSSSKTSVSMFKCFKVLESEKFKAGIYNFAIIPKDLLETSISSVGGKRATFDNLLCSARDSIAGDTIQCFRTKKPLNSNFDNIVFVGTSTEIAAAIELICAKAAVEVSKTATKDLKLQALIDR